MKIKFAIVEGYDYPYRVSNYGTIQVIKRTGYKKLKQFKNDKGYMFVKLRLNGKYKNVRVHRLVAIYFIENPDNLEIVNHKDEIKHNCRADNLEWCDILYNINYGTKDYKEIAVKQYTSEGIFIREYRSLAEAERQTKIRNIQKSFREYINSNHKTLFGYIWKEQIYGTNNQY